MVFKGKFWLILCIIKVDVTKTSIPLHKWVIRSVSVSLFSFCFAFHRQVQTKTSSTEHTAHVQQLSLCRLAKGSITNNRALTLTLKQNESVFSPPWPPKNPTIAAVIPEPVKNPSLHCLQLKHAQIRTHQCLFTHPELASSALEIKRAY